MAVETLHASLTEAARLTGLESHLPLVREIIEPQITYLGNVGFQDGREYPAYDGSTVSLDPLHPDLRCGGNRMDDSFRNIGEAVGTVGELGSEMRIKLAALGDPAGGRKGLIVANGRELSFAERASLMKQFTDLMINARLAGPFRNIISSDMNTAGLSDIYAQRYHEQEPDEALWRAVAAGKSPEFGGLAVRPEATAIGVMTSLEELMLVREVPEAQVAISGFGQVGARCARRISQSPSRIIVNAIGDVSGTIWTQNPYGLQITEAMVQAFGDNKDFQGDKLAAFALAHTQQYPGIYLEYDPDPKTCLYIPTDYLIPAAVPNVVTLQVAKNLGARRGVDEGGNGPTTPEAHRYLVEHGLDVLPDFGSNGRGVSCSRSEWLLNVSDKPTPPSDEVLTKRLIDEHRRDTQEVFDISREIGTPDLRVAASVMAYRRLIKMALAA